MDTFSCDDVNFLSLLCNIFVLLFCGSVIILVCITKVAKASLDKALAENAEVEGGLSPPILPIVSNSSFDLQKPLIIKIDPVEEHNGR